MEYVTSVDKKTVCQALRDVIEACSASTFMARAGSYSEEELKTLEKYQREQVRLGCTR